MVSGLVNLKELNLANNKLEQINFYAFENLAMENLYLQNNMLALDNMNAPFQTLMNLKKLNLSHNKLPIFLQNFYFHLSSLTDLDLSYNNITGIDMRTINFSWYNPIRIDLSNNNIRTIVAHPSIEKNHTHESKWILKGNPLSCDCNILEFVKFLRGELGNIAQSKINYVIDDLRCSQPEKFAEQIVSSILPKELLCPLDSHGTAMRYCPKNCTCWLRRYDNTAILNCSNIGLMAIPNITSIENTAYSQIEFYLESNDIKRLPRGSLNGFKQVTHLYLKNNSINNILSENLPSKLKVLDISNNNLKQFDSRLMAYLNTSHSLQSLWIGGNPWNCNCSTDELRSFLVINTHFIMDRNNSMCENKRRIIDRNDLCPKDLTILIAICIVIALLGLLIGAIIALYYKYQQEVKVWLFAHNLCLWFVTEEELDKDKKYDAFISFSHRDEDFVTEQLVPELEHGPHPFKICLHFRDWVVGEFIPTQVRKILFLNLFVKKYDKKYSNRFSIVFFFFFFH